VENEAATEKHQVPLFNGKLDLEGLLKWQWSVQYYARLAGMNEKSLISTALQNFTPDVLDWFTHLLQTQYNVDSFPPQYYQFIWAQLKCRTRNATFSARSSSQLTSQDAQSTCATP
jgi:hypothetical protein